MAGAALTSGAWAFETGDAMSPDALGKAQAIQGEAPKTWEAGKVYVLECWATWCGPCVQAIPHMDALYDKYKDKGLRVVGVNVMEDDKEKVAAFVKKKGDGMSYPVLFTGKEGNAFEKDYITPGKVDGIPYSFVIKDGKFLFGTHPMGLTDDLVEGLLAGGEKQDAVLKKFADKQKNEEESSKLMEQFGDAAEAKDPSKMEEALARLEKLDPENPDLESARLEVTIIKKDWPSLEKQLVKFKDEDPNLAVCAMELDEQTDLPESTRKAVLAKLLKRPAGGADDPVDPVIINLLTSRYQWVTGDKDGAKASAKKAIDKPGEIPAKVLKGYATSLDEGKCPTLKELLSSFEEEEPAEKTAPDEKEPPKEK